MTLRLPLLCKVGVKFFMVRQKRWWAINYKLMQQVYHMLSSSICVSVSSAHEFHQENHFQTSRPKQIVFDSKLHRGFAVLLPYVYNLWMQHIHIAEKSGPNISPLAGYVFYLSHSGTASANICMWITLFRLIPLNPLGWDGKCGM